MIDKKLESLLRDVPEGVQAGGEFSPESTASADPEIIADVCKEHVALDIRGAMKEKGFSQTGLADEIGVTRQYINQILGEMGNLTIATLSKMAAALDRQLVIRLIGEKEAMPVIPSSMLPDVRRLIHGMPTRREVILEGRTQALAKQLLVDRIPLNAPSESGDITAAGFVTDFRQYGRYGHAIPISIASGQYTQMNDAHIAEQADTPISREKVPV